MDWVYILIKLIIAFILMNLALTIVAFLVYFERKVAAHMQARQGPNRAGPLGLLQSFADLLKMLTKENTIPKGADKWVFYLAPVVATFTSLGALAIIPFGPAANQPGYIDFFGRPTDWFVANVNVGALMILALSSLGVYGIIMAGWGSNSKYSLLGGLRSSAQVISYEITLGISLVGVFLLAGTLDLTGIINAQHPDPGIHPAITPGVWFVLLQPVAFMVFLTSMIAETNRTPFDLPEAESELVGGYHTEYSGIRFGLFFLSEYIAMVIVSAMATICFLGGWLSPFDALLRGTDIPFISGLLGSGIHWFILKLSLFIFVYYWLRWTLPRFRYDQLMGLCWKVFLPLILANILIIAVLRLIFFPPGTAVTEYNPLYWWIIAALEIVLFIIALFGFSRTAGASWFGKAERAVLVDRQLILVRNVQGGRGTIEGEAKPVDA
ncbi:MAG TPA: NADH-quinone oxidoreductase subunit NuoH [Chloroflexia bacterium]|nr:NADH-quinone oxidoreductase subunit NuoH [Chloroflexia bacterium]